MGTARRGSLDDSVTATFRYVRQTLRRTYAGFSVGAGAEWLWRSPAALVLDRGIEWRGSSLPPGIRYSRRKKSACFYDALMLVQDHPEFVYCEGYACQPPLPLVHHGWCVDPGGGVVDVTWRPRDDADVATWVYIGVPIRTRFAVDAMLEQGSYFGVLHDSLARYRLLRTPAEVWWRELGPSKKRRRRSG